MSSRRQIIVTRLDSLEQQPVTTPTTKLAMPKSSPRSSSRGHSWVRGSSPRSACSDVSAKKQAALLAVPKQESADPYNTPKGKDDQDSACNSGRFQRALQAPKKRDELIDATARKNRAFDPENLQIRAFRLDSSSSDGDDHSTGSSDAGANPRQEALDEMRSQWADFTQRI